MKKLFSIFVILISFFLLSSCQNVDENVEFNANSIEFDNFNSIYNVKDTKLNIYNVKDSIRPYADVYEFVNALNGLYMTQYINLYVSRSNKTYNLYFNLSDGNNVKRILFQIDWINDTIYINDNRFFSVINQDGVSSILNRLKMEKVEEDEPKSITYKLNDYGFNIYYARQRCLVPLCILNTLFCSQNYYNIYNRGDKLFGAYYDITALNNDQRIKVLNLNVDKETIHKETAEERLDTYNHLRFVMDNFYGLKKFKTIDSFDNYLKDLKDSILSTDSDTYFSAYENIIVNLNELHSRIGDYGIYHKNNLSKYSKTDSSSRAVEYRATAKTLVGYANNSDLANYKAPSTYNHNFYPNIRFDDSKTVLDMFVPGFDAITNEVRDNKIYYDTFEFFKHAMSEAAKFDTVKDIVVDLSINGGGNISAFLSALGFINQDNLILEQYNTVLDIYSAVKVRIDTNGDGEFNDDDVYKKYNWYVLVSPVTFSAANAFSYMAKNMGVKLIGDKTGGGMCAVLPIVLNDQTTIEISSPSALYSNRVPTEGGVAATISLDYKDYYDVNKIKEAIDSSRA